MKKFNKGKWCLGAIVVVVVIVLLVFLYGKGFRITYAPDLENSWDAVSAFAAWFGVAMSFAAVLVAGFVARKQIEIAKKQNEIAEKQTNISVEQSKVALFEKRFPVYDKISKIIGVAYVVDKSGELPIKVIYETISSILEYDVTKDFTKPDATTVVELQCTRELVKQAAFLFRGIDRKNVDALWNQFQSFFLKLTLEVANNPTNLLNKSEISSKDEFISTSKSFSKKYADLMRISLNFNEVL